MENEYEETIVRLMESNRTDALTGLGNYAAFREYLSVLKELAIEFSVVLFDMTNLKQANRELGHFGADRVLQTVGDVIRRSDHDSVFRHGGDEFAIVLPYCDYRAALVVRDRVEKQVGVQRLPNGAPLAIIGAVCTVTPHDDLDVELNHADKKLESRKADWKCSRTKQTRP